MADIVELQNAYEAILLRNFRGQIDREQRNAEIEAVDASPLAAGLTLRQRHALLDKAVKRAAGIMDEVYFSPSSGRWQ